MTKKQGNVVLDQDGDMSSQELETRETDGTEVEIRLGITWQLKQYEMARADVFVRLPGKREEVDELAAKAKKIAKKHLAELVKRQKSKSDVTPI